MSHQTNTDKEDNSKTIAQIYDEVLEDNEWERNHFNK